MCGFNPFSINWFRNNKKDYIIGLLSSNFKKWKALKYLAHEPLYVWDANIKEKVSSTYGYNIGSGPRKLDGLRLLKEFLCSIYRY